MPKISFREVWHAIVRWSWIPVVTFLIGVIVMYIYVSKKPEMYTAWGTLNIAKNTPQVFSESSVGAGEEYDLEKMNTVEQGLLSSTVLLRVAKKHNLAADPQFLQAKGEPEALIHILSKRLNVELVKGSRLMSITAEDTDPERAKMIVEDIFTEYENWKNGESSVLMERVNAGLTSEEKRLRKKMDDSEKLLRNYREEHLVIGLNGVQETGQTGKLATLTQELSTATANRLRLESQAQSMRADTKKEGSSTLAARGDRGSLVLNLENQIATKEADFAKLKQRYLQKHPAYIEANEELKRLNKDLQSVTDEAETALTNDLKTAQMRERELQRMVIEAKQAAVADEASREEFAQLTRAAEIDRRLYSQVATRLQETQIGAVLNNASYLSWNDRPLTPVWPSGPNKKGFVLVGAFLGLMFGTMVALLLSLTDPRVREPSAVERKLRLPLLASLPLYSRQEVRDLSVEGDGIATLNRPAHLARYTATPRHETDTMQSLLFSSSFEGDGKSLCVMKCARTMVKQGFRTLVIDADFSDAGLSREYDRQRGGRHGLAAYLMGEAEPAEVLFETGLPGLWFLPTGALKSDSGDLLAGPGLRRLLDAITPMFDRVIFDMSAALESDDVQAVTRFVDASYIVTQKGRGKYSNLKETLEVLQSSGGNVAGFIWNEASLLRRRSDVAPVIEPVTYPAEVREVSPRGQNQPMPAPPTEAVG